MLERYNIPQLANLEATIAGILAGASLTVAVLIIERLIERRTPGRDDFDLDQAKFAGMAFITAFAISLAAAFAFAVIAGESPGDARLAAVLLFAAFVLSQCFVYLLLGLTAILFSVNVAHGFEIWTGAIFLFGFVSVGSHLGFSSVWSVAVLKSSPTFGDYADNHLPLLVSCIGLGIVPALVGFARVTLRHWGKWLGRQAHDWLVDAKSERLNRQRYWYAPSLCLALFFAFAAASTATFMVDSVPPWLNDYAERTAFGICLVHSVVATLSVIFIPRRRVARRDDD